MENKSFIAALVAGGSVTVIVTLLCWAHILLPVALLAGALAGAATSYLGYKPKETWAGVKSAWRTTATKSKYVRNSLQYVAEVIAAGVKRYVTERWMGAVLLGLVSFSVIVVVFTAPFPKGWPFWGVISLFALFGLELIFFIPLALEGLTTVLAMVYRLTKPSTIFRRMYEVLSPQWWKDKGRPIDGLTVFGVSPYDGIEYNNWMPLQVLLLALFAAPVMFLCLSIFLLVQLVKYVLFTFCPTVFCFCVTLNRNIHSEMRTMALVDGPLGGVTSFAIALYVRGGELLHDAIAVQLSFVALGAALSLVIGYFNHLIVARQILGLQPKT